MKWLSEVIFNRAYEMQCYSSDGLLLRHVQQFNKNHVLRQDADRDRDGDSGCPMSVHIPHVNQLKLNTRNDHASWSIPICRFSVCATFSGRRVPIFGNTQNHPREQGLQEAIDYRNSTSVPADHRWPSAHMTGRVPGLMIQVRQM